MPLSRGLPLSRLDPPNCTPSHAAVLRKPGLYLLIERPRSKLRVKKESALARSRTINNRGGTPTGSTPAYDMAAGCTRHAHSIINSHRKSFKINILLDTSRSIPRKIPYLEKQQRPSRAYGTGPMACPIDVQVFGRCESSVRFLMGRA